MTKLLVALVALGLTLGACASSTSEEVERAGERGVNATVGSLERALERSVRVRLPRWPVWR